MTDRRHSQRRRANRRRAGALQLVTALIVLALAGVSVALNQVLDEQTPPVPPPTPAVAVQGGRYVEGAVGFPATLNPLLATSQSEKDLCAILFRGLTEIDSSGAPQPSLAESWTVEDAGRTYRFRLRPDIRWHDGTPLTAQDVRFTVSLVQDPDFPGDQSLARFWRAILVETPSSGEVIFRLLEPFAAFLNYTALPIVPRHLLGGVVARDLARDPFSRAPTGNGPFRLQSLDRDAQRVTLQAFGAFEGVRPYLDQVEFRYFSTADALRNAVIDGEVDGTGALDAGALLRPDVAPDRYVVYAPEMNGYTALFFNLRAPLFENGDVRRALALGVDYHAIVNSVLLDRVVPGAGPIPPSSWAFLEQTASYDPQGALDQLSRAGWTDNDQDGVLENGSSRFSFSLLVNADDEQRVAVATEIAQQLSLLRIQALVQPVPAAEVSQALTSRQFSAAVFGWYPSVGDPDCFQLWHSSQADSGLNFVGLQDQRIDALLDEGRRTVDRDRRTQVYHEFQDRFASLAPAIVLYYPRYYFAVDSRIQGIEAAPVNAPSDRLRSIARWHDTEAGAAEQGGAVTDLRNQRGSDGRSS